ncbi:hypothetical protein PSCICE_50520 [Pseudomonas cichorii]|nr:hypothetical protein PSCICE_50520 [Pseudomonas cichorii]
MQNARPRLQGLCAAMWTTIIEGNDDMTKPFHAVNMHAVLAGTNRCAGNAVSQ